MPIEPTFLEAVAQWRNVVDFYEHLRTSGQTSSGDNLIDLMDVVTQALEGEFAGAQQSSIAASRSGFSSAMDATGALTAVYREIARTLDIPEAIDGSIDTVITRIDDVFRESPQSVNSRNITFGTFLASSANVGTGTILRLTEDRDGFPLEAVHLEEKIAICTSDMNTGAQIHEETFEIRGEDPGLDAVAFSGSGLVTTINAASARNSLLNNPSFSTFTGTSVASGATITALSDWTFDIGAVTDTQIVSGTGSTFRDFQGDPGPFALRVDSSIQISQDLDIGRTRLDADLPYYLTIAYNRDAAGTFIETSGVGTITIRMGTASATAVLSTSSAGWNNLRIAPPTVSGAQNWYDTFREDDLDIEIEVTLTSGQVIIDDVIFWNWVLFDGTYYTIQGNRVRFLRDDQFNVTDSLPGADAILQHWHFRTFGRYWPSDNTGGETILDPT